MPSSGVSRARRRRPPVHGLQSAAFLSTCSGAHDGRARTARGLSIRPGKPPARPRRRRRISPPAYPRPRPPPTLASVRLADELGEVLHRGVVGAGHALLVARVSRGDSHAARTAAAAPGRSADADAPRDAGERRRARGRGRYRAHGATPRHHAVGKGLRASSSLPPTRGRGRRRCGDLSKKKNVAVVRSSPPPQTRFLFGRRLLCLPPVLYGPPARFGVFP